MKSRLSRYMKVWAKGLGLSVSAEMAYKMSFFLMVISIAIGDLIGPLVSFAIYRVSDGLPGWSLMELILLQGISIFVFGFWHTFIGGISWEAGDYVAEGEFDILLLKPFPALAYLAALGFDFHGATEIVVGAALIIWAMISLHLFSLMIIPFAYLIILALIFMLSLSILTAALMVIFVRVYALHDIVSLMKDISAYPASIYSNAMRFAVSFVVPAAIAGYWPAVILTGKESLAIIPEVTLSIAVFFIFSILLWKFALSRYQSAGG